MKRIGLLGGMSWESTIEYYRLVNELVAERLGGLHSADCLLRSVDFAEIELLQREARWAEAGTRLAQEAQALEAAGAELLVLCTNTMHKLAAEIELAFGLARAFGGDYELEIIRGYPAQYNEPKVAGWLRAVAADLLGGDRIVDGQQGMGAEDFSYMAQRAPGAMFGLGVRTPGREPRYLHTPTFDIDEDALPIGAAIHHQLRRDPPPLGVSERSDAASPTSG